MAKKRSKTPNRKPVAKAGEARFVKLAHTLHPETLERIEYFAYKARVSKSAIIELALAELFGRDEDRVVASLRERGSGRRRRARE